MTSPFLEASTIHHGLSYLSQSSKNSKLWRLFWLCCISISLSVAAALIRANYLTWRGQTALVSELRKDSVKVRTNII